jgi:hypothetical protein
VQRRVARPRPQDVLDGEAHRLAGRIAAGLDGLEVLEQRGTGVPRHREARLDDVVAVQRGHRDEREAPEVEPGGPVEHLAGDRVEARLGEADEVHLVDAHGEVRHAQQGGDGRVAARLRGRAAAGVDDNEGQVGGRGPGDHVARVLRVPGAVGQDEAPSRRGEVAVGDVDRDALLALGAQPVGEQRELGARVPLAARHRLDVGELIAHQRLGVVEQPPDQRGLAVVDRAGGGDPQHAQA